jgi:hypothetical protein
MIDSNILEAKFAQIGARLKVGDRPRLRRRIAPSGVIALDINSDRRGEYFAVSEQPNSHVEVEVLDVQPADRHLLLMVREEGEKHKFLCGHDERHWFVAAVPENAPVGTVRAAKEALKPTEVHEAQARARLRSDARNRRKNAAYRRQGEWFFLPSPRLTVDEKLVLRNEPITRGNGGKPHWCEFCFRTGGETVYVCGIHPNGVDEETYRAILADRPDARSWGWRVMTRNASVYVRGRVRHVDHKTITLHGWHQVLMNTETQARAMRNLAFLD